MAIERRNPLPVGRYWFDVVERDWPKADAWTAANRANVKVERVDQTPKSSSSPATRWMLFRVTSPAPWDTRLGFPTIATADVKQPSDTATNPPTPGVFDSFPSLPTTAAALLPLVAIGAALYLMTTIRR